MIVKEEGEIIYLEKYHAQHKQRQLWLERQESKYRQDKQWALGPRWPGHYFCNFEKRLPKLEIKGTSLIHVEVRSNLAQCFIRSSTFYWKPVPKYSFTHPIIFG